MIGFIHPKGENNSTSANEPSLHKQTLAEQTEGFGC